MPRNVLERRSFVPEGYVPIENAGISISDAYRLRKDGVSVIKVGSAIYLYLQDLEQLKLPEGFLSLEDAAQESGYSIGHLRKLIRTGKIGSRKEYGRVYVPVDNLKNYKSDLKRYKQAPEGFLSLEDASRERGYTPDYLRRLASQKNIESRRKHGRVYVSKRDLEKYSVNPRIQMAQGVRTLILKLYDEEAPNQNSVEEVIDIIIKSLSDQGIEVNPDEVISLIRRFE